MTQLILEQALNGLQFGLMLFLLAAGLTLVFGIMDMINLAHGSLYMVGAYLAAAEAGVTILGDGVIATSALLAAARIEPHVLDYVVFCHKSAEAGHAVQLRALNADPLLDIGMRLGEGTGAMVAYPLLRAATAFMNEMASFESAGVSKSVR